MCSTTLLAVPLKLVKSFLLLISFILACNMIIAQKEAIQSLHVQLQKAETPEQRFQLLGKIAAFYYQKGYADSLGIIERQRLQLAQQLKALQLAEKLKCYTILLDACNNISVIYKNLDSASEELKYLKKAQDLVQK